MPCRIFKTNFVTMRWPIADQAKLLFLYLLRSDSSAALASESIPRLSALAAPNPVSFSPTQARFTALEGHISLRVARQSDVSGIEQCNLATLPENYNANFYVNHLRRWPHLALVAEHVPPGYESTKKRNWPMCNGGYDANANKCKVVGYVLGRVEERIVPKPSRSQLEDGNNENTLMRYISSSSRIDDSYGFPPKTENLGHVTSLAVLSDYRRKGLAAMLMNQLHHHMRSSCRADAVGLHVRVSNKAATKLYCNSMGYKVKEVITGYYQDGEDAYFMRKEFVDPQDVVSFESARTRRNKNADSGRQQRPSGVADRVKSRLKNFNGLLGNLGSDAGVPSRPWEEGPEEFRLPKIMPLGKPVLDVEVETEISEEEDGERTVAGWGM